jgi:hypothetical protein
VPAPQNQPSGTAVVAVKITRLFVDVAFLERIEHPAHHIIAVQDKIPIAFVRFPSEIGMGKKWV